RGGRNVDASPLSLVRPPQPSVMGEESRTRERGAGGVRSGACRTPRLARYAPPRRGHLSHDVSGQPDARRADPGLLADDGVLDASLAAEAALPVAAGPVGPGRGLGRRGARPEIPPPAPSLRAARLERVHAARDAAVA